MDVISSIQSIAYNLKENTTLPQPLLLFATANPHWCPAPPYGNPSAPPCTFYTPALLNTSITSIGLSDWSLQTSWTTAPYSALFINAVENAMYAMHAAVRLDWGIIFPNNILTNTSAIPATLQASLPRFNFTLSKGTNATLESVVQAAGTVPSNLYMGATNQGAMSLSLGLPLNASENAGAIIQTSYLCQFWQAKGTGEGFVLVLVATATMLFTIWFLVNAISVCVSSRKDQPG